MTTFDFRIFQNTDVRKLIQPEVVEELRRMGGEVSFRSRRALSDAFANPSAFLRDQNAQRTFINVVGHDRALKMMREFRLFGTRVEDPSSLSFIDQDSFGGRWRSLRGIVALDDTKVDLLKDGRLKIKGGKNRPDILADQRKIPFLISRLREASYRSREVGLPFNVLKSSRVDFIHGDFKSMDDKNDDQLEFDVALLPDIQLSGEKLLDVKAVYAPDIGVRMMGEPQLAIAANELLRMITRLGGDERGVDRWPYGQSIEALIRTFGDVDATPFIESVLDELIEEDIVLEGSRHLVIATYNDYLIAHVERRLQNLAGIEPGLTEEGTLSALMRSLFLALDSDTVPPEVREDEELMKIYRSARESLKHLVESEPESSMVKDVIKEYLFEHGMNGLIWFSGQMLPLVSLFGFAEDFRDDASNLIKILDPDAHYDWKAYPIIVEMVRGIVDNGGNDPNGGERMFIDDMDTPIPTKAGLSDLLDTPRTSNYAAPCIWGGLMLAGARIGLKAV